MDGLCIKVKSEEYNILPHALNFILPRGAASVSYTHLFGGKLNGVGIPENEYKVTDSVLVQNVVAAIEAR